jgi:hypothetical protein
MNILTGCALANMDGLVRMELCFETLVSKVPASDAEGLYSVVRISKHSERRPDSSPGWANFAYESESR